MKVDESTTTITRRSGVAAGTTAHRTPVLPVLQVCMIRADEMYESHIHSHFFFFFFLLPIPFATAASSIIISFAFLELLLPPKPAC